MNVNFMKKYNNNGYKIRTMSTIIFNKESVVAYKIVGS